MTNQEHVAGSFEIHIAEHICFDSNRAVDSGWLEPLS